MVMIITTLCIQSSLSALFSSCFQWTRRSCVLEDRVHGWCHKLPGLQEAFVRLAARDG